jgi:hypothetical protein
MEFTAWIFVKLIDCQRHNVWISNTKFCRLRKDIICVAKPPNFAVLRKDGVLILITVKHLETCYFPKQVEPSGLYN